MFIKFDGHSVFSYIATEYFVVVTQKNSIYLCSTAVTHNNMNMGESLTYPGVIFKVDIWLIT